jgi:hypothetical protein
VKEFLSFLEIQKKKPNIKLDQWNCFLEFIKIIGDSFPKGYTLDDSWPLLFDEFYIFYCKKLGIKVEDPFEEEN